MSAERERLTADNDELAKDIMRWRAATVFVAAAGILFVLWWFS